MDLKTPQPNAPDEPPPCSINTFSIPSFLQSLNPNPDSASLFLKRLIQKNITIFLILKILIQCRTKLIMQGPHLRFDSS
jgi:hypothetical protein